MTPCVYDLTILCGNTITSKRDCIGCEVRRDVLWDRKEAKRQQKERKNEP